MILSAVTVSPVTLLRSIVLASVVASFGACDDSSNSPLRNTPTRETVADAGGQGSPPLTDIRDSGLAGTPANPSDAGGTSLCLPGTTRTCSVDLLCTGTATCALDGERFGPCECVSTPSAVVGATCQGDSDCADGALCMSATSNDYLGQGGPAGGYCTFSCTTSDDCIEHDPSSTCSGVGPSGAAFCLRTCLSKAAEPGESKCLNRTDVACVSVVAAGIEQLDAERQLGFCAPQCGSDEDCPPGRQCHRQGGICTDFSSPGAPVGSACSLTSDCDGRACEDQVDGVGTCTAECVLGVLSGCGYGRNPISREAACVVPAIAAGRFSEGPGDLGLCLRLCDIDVDCQQANQASVCRPLNEELAAFFGRAGACGRGTTN